jgi:hypothetical protein
MALQGGRRGLFILAVLVTAIMLFAVLVWLHILSMSIYST